MSLLIQPTPISNCFLNQIKHFHLIVIIKIKLFSHFLIYLDEPG